MSTVFYSWQSDLEPATHRTFIEDALEKALKQLARDDEVYQPPREVDKDTAGVAGSPHIAETIFSKISAASACVFDVSIVLRSSEDKRRAFPNPNVLVELGYALKAHPDARVIMVMDSLTGEPEELPFDLRFRRVLKYAPVEVDGDRSKAKADFVKSLVAAFKATFAHNEANRFTPAEVQFFHAVYVNSRAFLNLHAELDDRKLGRPFELLRHQAGSLGDSLRDLATEDAAEQHPGIAADLKMCADKFDEVKAWLPRSGAQAYQEFTTSIAEAAESARTLLARATPAMRQKFAGSETASSKRKLARQARDQFERFKTAVQQKDSTHFAAMRQAFERTGSDMLGFAAVLEVLGDGDAGFFRLAAHVLHVAAIEKSWLTGYREEEELIARLDPVLGALARFA